MLTNYKNTILVFSILILLFVPFSLSLPAESEVRAVVTSVGLDYFENKYEVSAQVIIPQNDDNFNSSLQVFTSFGKSLGEAVEGLSLKLGKKIGLAHCSFIVVSDEFISKNLGKKIDVFYRGLKIGKNSLLINTESKSKDLLIEMTKLHNTLGLDFDNVLSLNEDKLSGGESTILGFINDYFSKSSVSFLSILNLEAGGISADISKSQTKEGGEEKNENKSVNNAFKSAIIQNGIKVGVLDVKELKSLNWLKKGRDGNVLLENVNSGEDIKDAIFNVEVKNKLLKFSYFEKGNIPELRVKMAVDVALKSISNKEQDEVYDINKYYINKEIKNKIQNKIKEEVSVIINRMKKDKIDYLDAFDEFYKHKYEFMKKNGYLNNIQDFLSKLNVFVEIKIQEN